MTRPWTPSDIEGIAAELHTRRAQMTLYRMVGDGGRPRARYATWTVAEVIAHCRNVDAEARRAYGHGTGAVPS